MAMQIQREAAPSVRVSPLQGRLKVGLELDMNRGEVWLLGNSYVEGSGALKDAVLALFRFTYRRDFQVLAPYSQTSDAGWGCMLRSAQMVLGTCMRRHYLGRDWKFLHHNGKAIPAAIADLKRDRSVYIDILKWFCDSPGHPHYYSLHHMVQGGMRYDKLPGEWFGPSTALLVLRDLAKLHRSRYGGEIELYIASGDTIYVSEVEAICTAPVAASSNASMVSRQARLSASSPHAQPKSDAGAVSPTSEEDGFTHDPLLNPAPEPEAQPWLCSLLVGIPLMLSSTHEVPPEAVMGVKALLRCKNCIGLLGGRPNHALYFVGYKENALLGLDPHTVYPAPDTSADAFPAQELLRQIHVEEADRVDFSRLDPSAAAAFYFRNRVEFDAFCAEWVEGLGKECTFFSIQQLAPSYVSGARAYGNDWNDDDANDDDDDYVLI